MSDNDQERDFDAESGISDDPPPVDGNPPNDEKSIGELDFETALAQLEAIVGQLELGQVNLTESLQQYEQGVSYLKQCYKLLEQAEQRVEVLSGTAADGTPQTEPFSDGDAESLEKKADNRSQRRRHTRPKTPKSKRNVNDGNVDAPRGLF